MPYVPDLDLVLTAGYRVEHDGIVYVVEPCELGPVVLPTGKVVGCDPLVPQATPFVDVVAPSSAMVQSATGSSATTRCKAAIRRCDFEPSLDRTATAARRW